VPNDRENILSALREKPLKVYEVMKRANVANEEACQSLLLKMRDEGLVKFDIHKRAMVHRMIREKFGGSVSYHRSTLTGGQSMICRSARQSEALLPRLPSAGRQLPSPQVRRSNPSCSHAMSGISLPACD